MKNILIFIFAACLVTTASCSKKQKESAPVITKKNLSVLEILPIKLSYKPIHKNPTMKHLHMIGSVGKFGVTGNMGKILRVLRYKNITEAVHVRYPLISSDIILAMIAQEDGGVDLLTNAKNDGGAGTVHMQPALAAEFGLHTYEHCDKMICKKHGLKLKNLISKNRADRKLLIACDDRLNPVQNLDAVGRMLMSYQLDKQIAGLSPEETMICRYSGSFNYPEYEKNLKEFVRLLNDTLYLKKVEEVFNKLNPKLKINGEKADFKKYLEVCQIQNENYGLIDYEKLGAFKF